MKNQILIITALLSLLCTNGIFSQENQRKMNAGSREEIEKKICLTLNEKYVFPDKCEKICSELKSSLKAGKYDTMSDPSQFAAALTNEIQSITGDKHLKVVFRKGAGKHLNETDNNRKPDPVMEEKYLRALRFNNFGFKTAERLNGNVGYINVTMFLEPKYVEESFASAVGFLQYADAIIIDLRFNGGGDPASVQLLCSYFLDSTPVHINDIYDRLKNDTTQYWSLKELKGIRLQDIPLYVLTSEYSFSAAEEFAYDLQVLKRAVIVGDTTRGGANPGATFPLDDDFVMFVPTGRAINPVTKTNWDGTGIIPDVPIASERALEKAQLLAIQSIIEKSTDESDKKYFTFLLESIEAEMNAPSLSDFELKKFTGTYSDRKITFDAGKLYYRYGERAKMKMNPVADDTFTLPDLDYVRLKFNKDSNGEFVSLTELTDTGDNETIGKNK